MGFCCIFCETLVPDLNKKKRDPSIVEKLRRFKQSYVLGVFAVPYMSIFYHKYGLHDTQAWPVYMVTHKRRITLIKTLH